MRVFVAGATGAIGSRLVPLLVEAGHQVTGMTRSSKKAEQVHGAGGTPAVADALDREAVMRAVKAAAPASSPALGYWSTDVVRDCESSKPDAKRLVSAAKPISRL
jgi:nucleoside-diphosphate-sugar epimerase|nr:NAD(P)H-binding protein [Pseudacidobacterium ailaaui]